MLDQPGYDCMSSKPTKTVHPDKTSKIFHEFKCTITHVVP